VPLLGQVPLDEPLREGADDGTPLVLSDPEAPSAAAIRELARSVPGVLRPRRGAERIKKPLAVL
jgi:ATP-binding protein involved in chromosome partitioning